MFRIYDQILCSFWICGRERCQFRICDQVRCSVWMCLSQALILDICSSSALILITYFSPVPILDVFKSDVHSRSPVPILDVFKSDAHSGCSLVRYQVWLCVQVHAKIKSQEPYFLFANKNPILTNFCRLNTKVYKLLASLHDGLAVLLFSCIFPFFTKVPNTSLPINQH